MVNHVQSLRQLKKHETSNQILIDIHGGRCGGLMVSVLDSGSMGHLYADLTLTLPINLMG